MSDPPDDGATSTRASLPARPETIAVARDLVGEVCLAAGAGDDAVGDARLLVTEACTNAVRHAYDGTEDGVVELSADVADGRLTLVVRDYGRGLTPNAGESGLGMGIPLMAALASSLTVARPADGGTELTIVLDLRPDPSGLR